MNCNKISNKDNLTATLSGKLLCTVCLKKNTCITNDRLEGLEKQLKSAQERLTKYQSRLFSSIIFSIEVNEANSNIKRIGQLIQNEKLMIVGRNVLAETVVSYPPDWQLRKDIVLAAHGGCCRKCRKKGGGHLHMHHISPLSRGGSNRLDNLEPLCRDCHSEQHSGRKIGTGAYADDEPYLAKRIRKLNEAIATKKNVSFGYRKSGEPIHKRRKLTPQFLVDETRGDGSISVCVVGYCHLRNNERQFALSKMKDLRILKT